MRVSLLFFTSVMQWNQSRPARVIMVETIPTTKVFLLRSGFISIFSPFASHVENRVFQFFAANLTCKVT